MRTPNICADTMDIHFVSSFLLSHCDPHSSFLQELSIGGLMIREKELEFLSPVSSCGLNLNYGDRSSIPDWFLTKATFHRSEARFVIIGRFTDASLRKYRYVKRGNLLC